MKRTNVEESPILRWKKLGGGSIYLKNRIIKPGQIFEATEDEIPAGARDVIVPADGRVEPKTSKKEDVVPEEVAEVVFTLKKKGGAYYNGEDVNGKVMNEKGLVKVDAEALIKSLTE